LTTLIWPTAGEWCINIASPPQTLSRSYCRRQKSSHSNTKSFIPIAR